MDRRVQDAAPVKNMVRSRDMVLVPVVDPIMKGAITPSTIVRPARRWAMIMEEARVPIDMKAATNMQATKVVVLARVVPADSAAVDGAKGLRPSEAAARAVKGACQDSVAAASVKVDAARVRSVLTAADPVKAGQLRATSVVAARCPAAMAMKLVLKKVVLADGVNRVSVPEAAALAQVAVAKAFSAAVPVDSAVLALVPLVPAREARKASVQMDVAKALVPEAPTVREPAHLDRVEAASVVKVVPASAAAAKAVLRWTAKRIRKMPTMRNQIATKIGATAMMTPRKRAKKSPLRRANCSPSARTSSQR